ncbi:MAG TPA: hypothetical protein VFP87_09505 [Chitinophagaceae bacterium]|nr:hypothetical protein [Chitinophagaceae bacterium]
MEAIKRINRPYPVLTQMQNNTTLWIGHLQSDPTDHFAGQTFTCPASGDLNNIQVYSAAVQCPGEIMLSVHAFDGQNKSWGPILTSAVIEIEKNDEDRWIRFDLPPMPLHKNEIYGFRLYANNAMIALGQAAASGESPFKGQEWHGDSKDQAGHFYNYFSLAFKVEMCA